MKASDLETIEYVKTHPLFIKLEEELKTLKGQLLQKDKRLGLFFSLACEMAPCSDNIEAKRKVDTIINTIEDSFSGRNYSPADWEFDGRMYPAQEDSRRKSEYTNIFTYRHLAHLSHFGTNGAIRIEAVCLSKVEVLLDRPGQDELTVENLREHPSSTISRIG